MAIPRAPHDISQSSREGFAVVHRKHKRRQLAYGPAITDVDEVFAVVGGEVEIFAEGAWRAAPAGSFACIARGQRHGVRGRAGSSAEVRILNIIFDAPARWRNGMPRTPVVLPTVWWRRLLDLEASAGFDARGQRVLRLEEVRAFIAALARSGILGSPATSWSGGPVRPDTGADWMSTWTAAEDVIRDRASSGLSAAQLARAVHASPTQLRRVFLAARGCSPKDAITGWRIVEAKRLLASGHHTVTQVARLVGYATVQRFTIMFRLKCGITPSAFARG
ncbi:MAG: helix-turn-helix transcriptional regulator [Planctomycetes bacterium]|nr:helix-turn-helix transcriptional regulator [Planctomycetota bacterium]